MGLRIQSNIAAANAHRQLTSSDVQLSKSLERLSSGFRINKAADDAAGLSVSSKLRATVASLKVAARNTNEATSLVQTAEGAMSQIGDMLTRLKELATQATSANAASDRDKINAEAAALISEVDRIATSTKYAGTSLINGSFGATASIVTGLTTGDGVASAASINVSSVVSTTANYTLADDGAGVVTMTNGSITQTLTGIAAGAQTLNFNALGVKITLDNAYGQGDLSGDAFTITSSQQNFQVGEANASDNRIGVSIGNVRSNATGFAINGIDLSTVANANTALDTIDTAISYLAQKRGDLGAIQNRLSYAYASLNAAVENTMASDSVIRDTDMASEMVNFTKTQILMQAGTAMLAQANQAPQSVLSLLR